MNTWTIITIIILVGVVVATINVVWYVYSRQQDQQRCLDWGYDIKLKEDQWRAKSQSLEGILDLDGSLQSEKLALQNEVTEWHNQCTQYKLN